MSKYTHLAGRHLEQLKSLARERDVTLTPDIDTGRELLLTTGYGDILGRAHFHRGRLTHAHIAGEHYTAAHAGVSEQLLHEVLEAIREATT